MRIFLSEVDFKSTGKSITCTQVSQSIDNDLVDYVDLYHSRQWFNLHVNSSLTMSKFRDRQKIHNEQKSWLRLWNDVSVCYRRRFVEVKSCFGGWTWWRKATGRCLAQFHVTASLTGTHSTEDR